MMSRLLIFSLTISLLAAVTPVQAVNDYFLYPVIHKRGHNGFGTGADGPVTISSNTNLTSTTDGGYVIKQYSSLTINSGESLSVSNRCAGLIIFCTGNINVQGNINMDGKGLNGSVTLDRLCRAYKLVSGHKGGYLDDFVLNSGAGGGSGRSHSSGVGANGSAGTAGSAGSAGQAGGGGGGGAAGNGNGDSPAGNGGNGTAATSCGGTGGGGSGGGAHLETGPGGNGGAGTTNGGSGGNGGAAGATGAGGGGGGAGNNGGSAGGGGEGSPTNGANGTGGVLIIVCGGTLTVGSSGRISANGENGGNGANAGGGGGGGGGGTGGGNVIVLAGGAITNSGSIQANGGSGGSGGSSTYEGTGGNGGNGGAGSVQGPTQIAAFVRPNQVIALLKRYGVEI
jgi:hypothetical protein